MQIFSVEKQPQTRPQIIPEIKFQGKEIIRSQFIGVFKKIKTYKETRQYETEPAQIANRRIRLKKFQIWDLSNTDYEILRLRNKRLLKI